MYRSTYLPLTKAEIEAKKITSVREYIAYVYKQLVYYSRTEDGTRFYKIYSSDNLHEALLSAMIAYFGEKEENNITYILDHMFREDSFEDAELTDDIWHSICYLIG